MPLQEPCEEEVEPTNLECDDDVLFVEYESCSCGLDVNMGFAVDLCVEYEPVSFNTIITTRPFESHMPEFVESQAIVTENFDLDQTLAYFDIKWLVDFETTVLPGPAIHDDTISISMTSQLASVKDVHLLPEWAQQFDKLKRALTCASVT